MCRLEQRGVPVAPFRVGLRQATDIVPVEGDDVPGGERLRHPDVDPRAIPEMRVQDPRAATLEFACKKRALAPAGHRPRMSRGESPGRLVAIGADKIPDRELVEIGNLIAYDMTLDPFGQGSHLGVQPRHGLRQPQVHRVDYGILAGHHVIWHGRLLQPATTAMRGRSGTGFDRANTATQPGPDVRFGLAWTPRCLWYALE